MTYEQHYRDLAAKSRILRDGAAGSDGLGQSVEFVSRAAVQQMINNLIVHNGTIPKARATVEAWETRIAQHQRTTKALGLGGQVPPPDDMQDQYDRARAEHDVLIAERDRLIEIRDSFGEEANEDRREKILASIGNLKVTTEFDAARNLSRTAYDHQCVSMINTITGVVEDASFNPRDNADLAKVGDQHVIAIDDEASPYDGMSLMGYRGIRDEVRRQRNGTKERWIRENAQKPVDERESEANIAARARQYKPSPWPPEWLKGAKDYKHSTREESATG